MGAVNENTFTRLVAFSYRFARGPRAAAFTGLVAGLLPDLAMQASWNVLRWLLPLRDSPGDLLPYLLRELGLPAYETELPYPQEWNATMGRLELALDTHSRAGSRRLLEQECDLSGVLNSEESDLTGSRFEVIGDNVGAEAVIDDFTIGDGSLIGAEIDARIARNVARVMHYFKPARSVFMGLRAP